MNEDIIKYYELRASEYEEVYAKPERQADLLKLSSLLQKIFKDQSLIEIACGTGYWTERIAKTACAITATDINASVIEIAKKKDYHACIVEFMLLDIFEPIINTDQLAQDNLFGGFIWSHIKLSSLPLFLTQIHKLVKPGGKVVMVDNRYVPESNRPITHTDQEGNTYQTRQLADGSNHLVLKNFPGDMDLIQLVKPMVYDLEILRLDYYWLMVYTKA